MANFPSIKPTNRSFTLGEYPTKIYRSLSGKTVRRSFGNRPFGATLELTFENVSETVLSLIYAHYHGQRGNTEGFFLSNETLAGLDSSSNTFAQLKAGDPYIILQQAGIGSGSPTTMLWFYESAPEVESTYRNLSTISLKLVSEFAQ
jgi:hypothetical protein